MSVKKRSRKQSLEVRSYAAFDRMWREMDRETRGRYAARTIDVFVQSGVLPAWVQLLHNGIESENEEKRP